jgi:hypothetical protein
MLKSRLRPKNFSRACVSCGASLAEEGKPTMAKKYTRESQEAVQKAYAVYLAPTPRQQAKQRRETFQRIKEEIVALPAEDRQQLALWIAGGCQDVPKAAAARRGAKREDKSS